MEKVYLISYGEIGLKGDNKKFFINSLVKKIKYSLKQIGDVKIKETHGRIFVKTDESQDIVMKRLKKIFGISSISLAYETNLSMNDIFQSATELLLEEGVSHNKSFKCETRRSNKGFELKSPEISKLVGGHILKRFEKLNVNVHEPDYKINIEIREKAYIYININKEEGLKGLPIGVSGKSLLLLSGGIDSPVAGWLTMKRGVEVEAVYFHSFPFTGERTKEKVIDICKKLAEYNGKFKLYVVNFTEILKNLQKNSPENYLTITMRRMMIRISEKIANNNGCLALVTGESIGQVASQTLENLLSTNSVSDITIIRPLITYDKEEIIKIADKIDTYNISIRPYDDCCSLFVPKHPKIRPNINDVESAEKNLNIDELIKDGLSKVEVFNIKL